MHITVIANNFQEEYLYNLLNNLSPKVQRLDFIGSSLYQENKLKPNINFYKFRYNHTGNVSALGKFYRILIYYWRLVKYLMTTESKTIHLQWLRFYIIEGILIALFIKALNKKVVYTAHNVIPHNKDKLYYRTIFKIIYKIQSQIIVHTSHIKNQLTDQYGINSNKIHVVPHGVYFKEKDSSLTKSIAKTALGLSLGAKVILFFGYINEYKGLDILVNSIDLLDDQTPIEILIAGTLSPSYKKKFESIMKGKKHGKYLALTEYVDERTLNLCFTAADVTVLPYKEASQSGVLFMSYSFGVPVIAPSLGGFPDDILLKKTGYLFEAFNPESLSRKILEFLEDWSNAGEEQEQSIIDFATKNYSWENSCKSLIHIYSL